VSSLQGRTVVLAVTGSVAAYKAVEVARLLKKRGARVIPVLTRSGEKFVGAVTLSGITGEAVRRDMWDPSYPGELHVALADAADAILVVPATADVLARFAEGRADDLLTALALSAKGPVLVAPSMHPRMWAHPATQRNARVLEQDGRVTFVGPVHGEVASGDVGLGRMAEPEAVVEALAGALGPRDLAGVRVLVSAGPTHEPIDPVRFLGNTSSGKMGFAIARAAAERGADVTIVAGPTGEVAPRGVARVDVRTALEMQAAIDARVGPDVRAVDVVIMAAAVADFRVADPQAKKIKKSPDAPPPTLVLVKNPDLLAGLGERRAAGGAVLVGFALETGTDAEVVAYAQKKLAGKRVDAIVANHAAEALGTDTNRVAFVTESGAAWLPGASKPELAREIVALAVRLLCARGERGHA